MARVEIYKLKKTAPPQMRTYSAFDYMRNGENPNALYYVREWAGEMQGTLPLTIPGRLMLEPPEDYHGGNIINGDIAVVNGTSYFFDSESGAKFVEIDFDATAARDEIHVTYGLFVDLADAEAISDDLAFLCEEIGVPCGHLGESCVTGIYSGRRPFIPGASDENHMNFLHPEFLKGEEARAFTSLLSELTESPRWREISNYLRDYYPASLQDLEMARELFAPWLLLPDVLRSLAEVIAVDADKSELAYLAAKVSGLSEEQRFIFDAVIEAGCHCGSVAEIINLTDNLDRFELQPVYNPKEYGASYIEMARDEYAEIMNGLEQSVANPAERDFFYYIAGIEANVDLKAYGEYLAELDGGEFTEQGYLTTTKPFQEFYKGTEDIPAEYRASGQPSADRKNGLIAVCNTDLPALLLQIHALGGDYLKDAKHNLHTLSDGGAEFIALLYDHAMTVIPADMLFRKGDAMHVELMQMNNTSHIQAFYISVTDKRDGHIIGDLYETDIAALKSSIRKNSIKHNDPASEGQLVAYLDDFQLEIEKNRRAVPTAVFLQHINEPYMAQSNAPMPEWFRVSPDAAKVFVAQDTMFIYKTYPDPIARLMPIDATKASLWNKGTFEYCVRHNESENLELWARRAAGEMLRHTERGEQRKSRDTEI